MGKPHFIELRERVVAFVDEGNSHRAAARHFRVSPKFVNDMVKLSRETGALLAKPQGNMGRTGKLNGLSSWERERLVAQGELALDELCLELVRALVCRLLTTSLVPTRLIKSVGTLIRKRYRRCLF